MRPTGDGKCVTHIVHTKVVQGLGDLNLLLGVEKSVGELLALSQRALDDLEARNIAQEVGDSDIVAVGIPGRRVRVLAGLDGGKAVVRVEPYSRHEARGQDNDSLESKDVESALLPLAWPFTPFAPLACPFGVLSAPGHIL